MRVLLQTTTKNFVDSQSKETMRSERAANFLLELGEGNGNNRGAENVRGPDADKMEIGRQGKGIRSTR